jgi:hypothetical protein
MTRINYDPLAKNRPMTASQTMIIVIITMLTLFTIVTTFVMVFGESSLPEKIIPAGLIVPLLLAITTYFVKQKLEKRRRILREFASVNDWLFDDSHANTSLIGKVSNDHYLITGDISGTTFSLFLASGLEEIRSTDPDFSYRTLLIIPSSQGIDDTQDGRFNRVASDKGIHIYTKKLLLSAKSLELLFQDAGLA